MIELAKRLASKSQVDIALDLVDKNKEKKTFRSSIWVILLVKVTLVMMDHKIIWYFNQFIILLQEKLVILKQSEHGNAKDWSWSCSKTEKDWRGAA